MIREPVLRLPAWIVFCALVAGCGGAVPPAVTPDAAPDGQGSEDTLVAPDPSKLGSGYRYRFQLNSPSNDNFAITEREVYLYFWPDTSRVTFRMENRRGTQIKILWDQFRFTNTDGIQYKTVHEGITYDNRNLAQEYKIVYGHESYADWIAPVDLMEDPDAAAGRGMRLLFPTDVSAMSFLRKKFTVLFVLEIDDIERRYNLRFQVDSVVAPE